MTMNNLFYRNNYLGKPIQFLLEKLEIRRWLYNIDKNRTDIGILHKRLQKVWQCSKNC